MRILDRAIRGSAKSAAGTQGFINLNAPLIDPLLDYQETTFGAWMKFGPNNATFYGSFPSIVYLKSGGGTDRIGMQLNNLGRLYIRLDEVLTQYTCTIAPEHYFGWRHVAAAVSPGSFALLVDGIQRATNTWPYTDGFEAPGAAATFRFFSEVGTINGSSARDFFLYNRRLSIEEIRSIYQTGKYPADEFIAAASFDDFIVGNPPAIVGKLPQGAVGTVSNVQASKEVYL